MKFKYKLPTIFAVILAIFIGLEIATLLYYLCKFIGLFGLYSASLAVDISGAVVCLLVHIVTIFFLRIRYVVSPEYLKLQFGFVDLFGKKARTENILNIVYKKNIGKIYFSYRKGADDPVIALLSIEPSRVEEFVGAVKMYNKNVLYEVEE